MRRTVVGSATKFCPSARLGARPCSASSSRIRVGVCVTAPASQTPNSYTPPQQNRHNPPQPPIPPSTAIPANDATTQRRNDATTQRRNESVSPKRYRARRVGSAAEARPAQPLGVWGSPPDTSRRAAPPPRRLTAARAEGEHQSNLERGGRRPPRSKLVAELAGAAGPLAPAVAGLEDASTLDLLGAAGLVGVTGAAHLQIGRAHV